MAVALAMAIFLFVCGAVGGSFFNVAFDRLRTGGSIMWPPSHCMACDTKLRPVDLVPLFSYLWLRGRCRYCKAPIPRHVFLGELGCGLATAVAYLVFIQVFPGS